MELGLLWFCDIFNIDDDLVFCCAFSSGPRKT